LTVSSIGATTPGTIELTVNKPVAEIEPTEAPLASSSLPPGPSLPRPLLLGRFILQPTSFLVECERRYGDYFTLRLSNDRTMVITSDPAAVKTVFTGDPEQMLAGKNNEILRPLLGDRSVLLLDGREHMRQRRLMLPPFHGERMMAYGETMRAVGEHHVADWPHGTTFAAAPSMQAITLEIILRTVFGLEDAERIERVGAPLRRLLDATASQLRLLALQVTSSKNPRPRSPWGRFNQVVAAADRVVYEEIHARRAQVDSAGHDDILSMLLEARDEDGQPLTDLELRDELMTLLLAGHETTATALSWTLERLVRHPDVVERLVAERRGGDDDAPYLEATIKEALRLRPVVTAVGRHLTAPLEVGGRVLPAGVSINPSIYLLHRRPDLYPEPEAFRPERFLDDPPGTYQWIPFGGGVRRCLGASFALYEMKIVLQTVLDRVALVPRHDAGEQVTRRAITFAPKRGARIAVEAA
jgi:cytochrome P450 family 135